MTEETTVDDNKTGDATNTKEIEANEKVKSTESSALSQDPLKEETKEKSPEEEKDTTTTTTATTKPTIHLADSSNEHVQRSHTFRQRRLTYTRHHVQAAAALMLAQNLELSLSDEDGKKDAPKPLACAKSENKQCDDDDDPSDEKQAENPGATEKTEAAPERKKKTKEVPAENDTETKKRKKDDETEAETKSPLTPQQRPSKRLKSITIPSKSKRLESRILHAGEIKRSSPPPTPTPERGWRRKRQHRNSLKQEDEIRLLPFPRNVVGTYSCHGVEPLYDSDYEHEEDEDEDLEMEEDGNDTVEEEETLERSHHKTSESAEGGAEGENGNPATVAKINQDRGGVAFPYGNCPRTALFAAYDGHGDGGELVSQYSLNEVQRRLEIHPSFHTDIEKAFHETFLAVDEELKNEPDIEPLYSGSTACVVLLRDEVLTIANVGDSRAVIAREKKKDNSEGIADSNDEDNNNAFESVDLSVDQNPDSPGEQERIIQNGGFVSPPPEEGLSARVWLDESYTQIGLAMARSLGDHAVKPVGVIADPVVSKHELTDEDEFMIIATDGVWEFISSEEAVNIVGKHLKKGEGSSKACQVLIEAAAEKWHEFEGDYRDDITALVIQLKKLWDSVSDKIQATTDDKESEEGGVKSTVV